MPSAAWAPGIRRRRAPPQKVPGQEVEPLEARPARAKRDDILQNTQGRTIPSLVQRQRMVGTNLLAGATSDTQYKDR